jgi:hypothetical protein
MRPRWIVATALAATLGLAATGPAAPPAAACHATPPAALKTSGQARWLGDCPAGAATGLGVMRIGSAEPYKFFVGEMKGGLPVRGLMMLSSDGWEMAAHFDAAGQNQSPRSWDPKDWDAMFALAVRAAHSTAQRFAATGNRPSAAYYDRLAGKIRDGQPE